MSADPVGTQKCKKCGRDKLVGWACDYCTTAPAQTWPRDALALVDELRFMEWGSPEHAEQLLKAFIEKACNAVPKVGALRDGVGDVDAPMRARKFEALEKIEHVARLVRDSIDAAWIEGLHEAMEERDGRTLVDLLRRRILYHGDDLTAALMALDNLPPAPLAPVAAQKEGM